MNFLKKILFSLLLFIIASASYGQVVVPEGILFQAVARDANNNAASNRNVYVQIAIKRSTTNGTTDYAESFKVVSSQEGIFSIVIGQGTRTAGVSSLKNLEWSKYIYFVNLRIAIEPTLPDPSWAATNNYVDIGTSQLWTVPYSFTSNNSIFSDSASTITGILSSNKGGTGVNNNGKTITIANNIITKGVGDLTITTTAASNVTFPVSGTLANTQYVSDRIGTDTISLSNRINQLGINSNTSTNLKLNIADTSNMLNNRIGKDTISLSNRVNLKADKLNAKIDSSLYVKGKTTTTDSLLAKANVLIDSNLYVKGGLRVGGRLQLDSGLKFNDSLVISRGARIDSSLLVKGKIFVKDSLLAKGNVLIDSNLFVKGVNLLQKLSADSTLSVNRLVTDSTVLASKSRSDSTTLASRIRVAELKSTSDSTLLVNRLVTDSTVLASKSRSDSTTLASRIRVAELKSTSDSTLLVNRLITDSTVITGKLRSDSTTLASRIRVAELKSTSDSTLLVNILITDSTVLASKSRADSTTLASRIRVAELKSTSDSTLLVNRLVTDSTVLASKSRADSTTHASRIRIAELKSTSDSTLSVNRLVTDSTVLASKSRADSTTLASRIRVAELKSTSDSTLLVNRLVIDSTVLASKSRADSTTLASRTRIAELKSTSDSTLLVNRLVIDSNVLASKIRTDSTILIDSIKLKINIKDSATMLTNYARKFTQDYKVKIAPGKYLGKYMSGDSVRSKGMTLDQFLSDIITEVVHPTYVSPTVTLTSPTATDYEIGSNISSINLTKNFVQNDAGVIVTTTFKKNGVSLAGASDNISNLTTDQIYTVQIDYAAGAIKLNNLEQSDPVGSISAGTITSAGITLSVKSKRFWGTSSTTNPTDLEIQNAMNEFTTSKEKSSFSISVSSGTKYLFYAYPAGYSNLSSLSVGGFESLPAFTPIIRTFVNTKGYSSSYIIYVSNNNFSSSVNNINCK